MFVEWVYNFDGDKSVTEFWYEEPYELWERYYEVHVGNELNEPNRPEGEYKYEIKNGKDRKLGSEKNIYRYTVVYE